MPAANDVSFAMVVNLTEAWTLAVVNELSIVPNSGTKTSYQSTKCWLCRQARVSRVGNIVR